MNALHLALRALDPHQFEHLVFHLLKERHPQANITRVNGVAGDEGIDIFAGQLDGRPNVWQCKAFAHGVGESQKHQIRDSLNQALHHCRPQRWVLCLSSDLDPKALRWFQRYAASKSNDTEVTLWQASEIVHQLLWAHTIREQFFPGIVINTTMLREHLNRTTGLSTDDLAALTEENAQTYLARRQAHDQRLAYSITHHRDTPPIEAPGTIASITSGSTTINIYARDLAALRRDPPTLQLHLTEDGVNKLREFQRTGQAQAFVGPTDLVDFTTHFDFLLPPVPERNFVQVHVECTPTLKVPLRLTFGKDNPVVYEYLEFVCTRVGTEELVLENTTRPFRITILFGPNRKGMVTFTLQAEGHDVMAVRRFITAMSTAARDGIIECYDLERGARLGKLGGGLQLPKWIEEYQAFIEDVATICDVYGVTLTMPSAPTEQDVNNIRLLAQYALGKQVALDDFTLELRKVIQLPEALCDAMLQPSDFRLTTPANPESVTIFGTTVPTGMITIDIPKATIQDAEGMRQFLRDAAVGTTKKITLTTREIVIARRYPNNEEPDDPQQAQPAA